MKQSLIILLSTLLWCACSSAEKENQSSQEKQIQQAENYVEYYSNGLKKLEGKKIDGKRHGKWIYYYDNGMMWSEGTYKHGIRDGHSVVYYENGKKKIEGQYKKDLRVGVWKVWEDDGNLVKEINLDKMLSKEDSVHLGMH